MQGHPSVKVDGTGGSRCEWVGDGLGAGGASVTLFACEGWIARTRHQCDTNTLTAAVPTQRAELAVWVTGTTPSDWHPVLAFRWKSCTAEGHFQGLGCVHVCVHTHCQQRPTKLRVVDVCGGEAWRDAMANGWVAGGQSKLVHKTEWQHTHAQWLPSVTHVFITARRWTMQTWCNVCVCVLAPTANAHAYTPLRGCFFSPPHLTKLLFCRHRCQWLLSKVDAPQVAKTYD